MNSIFCPLQDWWLSLNWFERSFCLKNSIYWTKVEGKMVLKLSLSNLQKIWKGNFNLGGMESLWKWFLWFHIGLGHSQGSSQANIGPFSPPTGLRNSQSIIKCYFLRVKKLPKNSKKSRINFFGFFFLRLKH